MLGVNGVCFCSDVWPLVLRSNVVCVCVYVSSLPVTSTIAFFPHPLHLVTGSSQDLYNVSNYYRNVHFEGTFLCGIISHVLPFWLLFIHFDARRSPFVIFEMLSVSLTDASFDSLYIIQCIVCVFAVHIGNDIALKLLWSVSNKLQLTLSTVTSYQMLFEFNKPRMTK